MGPARGRSTGRGSFSPLARVALTLFGILPALGHHLALSPGAAWIAQLPQREPATSPNGRNSSRVRNNKTPHSCSFKCPLLPGRHTLPESDTASQPRPHLSGWQCRGEKGGEGGSTSAHHRNVGWQGGVLFHYKALPYPLSRQLSPKHACLSFPASGGNCHPAPVRARNADQVSQQGEWTRDGPRCNTLRSGWV